MTATDPAELIAEAVALIPDMMIDAAKESIHDLLQQIIGVGWSDAFDDFQHELAAQAIVGAFSTCNIWEQTGIAFDDDPDTVYTGSDLLTETTTRQLHGRPTATHEARRVIIATPGEKIK